MADLSELTTPLTRLEIETAIYDALAALGVTTTSWKPGAVARTIVTGVAIVLSAFSGLQALIAESGFLELAEGDWLVLVAKFVYDVTKNTGTFAVGSVTLDNTGGGLHAVAIGDLVVLNSTTGKTYRNTAAFILDPLETGEIVPVQAEEIGTDSNAAAGQIDTLQTVLLGVTVTNPTALVGTDPETDTELRERCLAKTGVLSPNGPSDAYRFLALSATKDDGTTVNVTRVTTTPDGEGNVSVVVGSATGPVTGTIGDTSTDLGAADEAIQTQAVPLAVTATTTSAEALGIPISYSIWLKSTIGLTASEVTTLIESALATYVSGLPIGGLRKVPGGGFIFIDALEGVIAEAVGTTHLIDLEITAPAADQSAAADEAPVLGVVTPTITFVTS